MKDVTKSALSLLDTVLSMAVSFGHEPLWLAQLSFATTHICLATETGPGPYLVQGLGFFRRLYHRYADPLTTRAYLQTEAILSAAARILGVMYPIISCFWSSMSM